MAAPSTDWQPTACILCECNCGIEVRVADDGIGFDRVRGDKAHPGSKGYTCEKALRVDHYQRSRDRLLTPMRRRDDGSYEAVDWDTAIAEVAAGLAKVRDEHGGEAIVAYGGGGQGNHLGGAYSGSLFGALGVRYRSNALAQEKTGEAWVAGQMIGAYTRGDFAHAEVSVFVGKNPYMSHGMPHARTTLKEIARDPKRSMIVIDPRRSETAELADIHLQVRPGTDAWCLTALAAVVLQEGLVRRAWTDEHVTGLDALEPVLAAVDVDAYAAICDVDAELLRTAARRIAGASSVAVGEDLGVQMGLHSTLCSYLERLLWVLTGNFGTPGTMYAPTAMRSVLSADRGGRVRTSPVVGARIISGLVPCNVIPEEILTDHPARYRAIIVESGNPVHSLADSRRWREAFDAVEFSVVIDVAMTETARCASYVLPAPTQYEKYECTFFNFEFPENVFQLRHPVIEAPDGPLPEPEIHARLVEALGTFDDVDLTPLHEAAERGLPAYGAAFLEFLGAHPELGRLNGVLLYRTLGPVLPDGAAAAAILWGAAQQCALANAPSIERAGIHGEGTALGDALFEAILANPRGVTFTVDEYEDSWKRVHGGTGVFDLANAEMLEATTALATTPPPASDPAFPLVLSAGERRSFTANTIMRDPAWRKKDERGALRISAADAEALGFADGDEARLTTSRGTARVVLEVTPMMRAGHISLPNGYGLGPAGGDAVGVAPNELTALEHRDPIAGTPYHKHVPARLEPLGA